MPNIVIVGAQWGDEGKGKVVDLIAPCVDVVARYSGGPNAGHTIVAEGRRFVLQLVPSGVLRPGKKSVIGCGTVVDPVGLVQEEVDHLHHLARLEEVREHLPVSVCVRGARKPCKQYLHGGTQRSPLVSQEGGLWRAYRSRNIVRFLLARSLFVS